MGLLLNCSLLGLRRVWILVGKFCGVTLHLLIVCELRLFRLIVYVSGLLYLLVLLVYCLLLIVLFLLVLCFWFWFDLM